MKTYVVNDISPPVPYLVKFWVSSYWPKHCQPIKLHDSLKCNISWKKWMMNFIFGMQIKIEVHHSGCVYPGMSKVPKMSLHIFAISPEKHGRWGWCFLSVDKHKQFLQVESITMVVLARHVQSIQNKFTMSLQYLKENVKYEVDFLPADKRFLQSDTIILNVCEQACLNYPK